MMFTCRSLLTLLATCLIFTTAYVVKAQSTSPPTVTTAQPDNCTGFDPAVIVQAAESTTVAENLIEIQSQLCPAGGCSIALCFAIDGGETVDEIGLFLQKFFVSTIATLAASGNASLSAVQYGLSNTFISSSTKNLTQFLESVNNVTVNNSPRTFIGGGLGFCASDLANVPGDVDKKILLIGNGANNFGTDALPLVLAGADDIDILALPIGMDVNDEVLMQITGDQPDLIFPVTNLVDVVGLTANLTLALCST